MSFLTKTKNKIESGFTLVELVVVMAIMFIMATVIFVNERGDARQDVEAVAQQVSAQLRNLQNESLAGKQVDVGGVPVSACRFVFDSSALTSYAIKYDKNCGGAESVIGSTTISLAKKFVKMDAKVVSFISPRGDANSANVITLTSTKDSNEKRYVKINSNGNVIVSTSP